MRTEAKAAGQYKLEVMGRNYDQISIVTIREIVEENKRLDIPVPLTVEVLATARRVSESNQLTLPMNGKANE